MSTPFYDLASLVVVPSGYKSGKIYAQKPLTTDGQLTFTRASTATRVNASGLIETVSSGVPRLDYTNSSCPKILLEPQRSNLAVYSQDFSNAAWLTINATKVSTTVTDPAGTSTGCNVTFTGGSTNYIYQSLTQNGTYTVSVYVKSNGGGNTFRLFGDGTSANSANLTATNTWQRFSFTFTSAGGTSWGITSDTSNSAANLLVAFAQIEVGAYGTSYIPTTSAAVTRLEDRAYKSLATSIIGQTEGTMFVEMKRVNKSVDWNFVMCLYNGATGDFVEFLFTAANNLVGHWSAGGVYNALVATGPYSGTVKMALAYKSGQYAFYVNGVQIGTNTATGAPACNLVDIGWTTRLNGYPAADGISQALLFKTRLTNAQLAELTTL